MHMCSPPHQADHTLSQCTLSAAETEHPHHTEPNPDPHPPASLSAAKTDHPLLAVASRTTKGHAAGGGFYHTLSAIADPLGLSQTVAGVCLCFVLPEHPPFILYV
jgi:hypothetical protein